MATAYKTDEFPVIRRSLLAEAESPKAYERYLDEARARQADAAVNTPFLHVGVDELARADLAIGAPFDPEFKRAQQDEFLRLYGVRRGDDLRVEPVTVKVSGGNPKLLSIVTKDGPWTADERAYVDACEREAGL